MAELHIPVVDLSKVGELSNLKPGTTSWVSIRKAVCNALEEYGCFEAKLSSDEVPLELHNSIFEASEQLLGFPKHIKAQNIYHDKPFRGHFSNKHALTETVGVDNPTDFEQTQNFAKLFWPNGNDRFSETTHSFAKVVVGLDQLVTKMIFDHYGVEKNKCESHIGSTEYALKFHKYKVPTENIETDSDHVSLHEHKDMTMTAIIHQNQVNGLEVRTKDGQLIGFDASPSSFIIFTGDAFQVWSNDRIKSCSHRVLLSSDRVRYSVVLFTYYNGTIRVPEELIDEKHPLRYKPLNHPQYMASQLGQKTRVSLEEFCGL